MATKERSTQTLVLMLASLAVVGIGGIGLLQGMGTRQIAPWAAACLGVGAVMFLISLAMLAKGHSTDPFRFCNRCGEIVAEDATACQACGHVLA